MKYSAPLMKTDDWDDEENWIGCVHDEEGDDDDDDDTPVYLLSGKQMIMNRDHRPAWIAEGRQIVLLRNSGNIRGKSNVVIVSNGKVCFWIVKNANRLKGRRNQNRQGGWSRHHLSTSQKGIRSQL